MSAEPALPAHVAGRRPRVLVLNQYYAPGVEATAHLLSQLCEALAHDYEVTVVTGSLGNDRGRSGRTMRDGVDVIRVRSTSYDRSRLSLRAVNYLTYLVSSAAIGLGLPAPDVVLCMTDPPVIADIAWLIARRTGAPLVVISQDVFPEIAVELRRLQNPLVVALVRSLIHFYLRRADRVVAIGKTMSRRLEQKGADPARLRVIPNWVETAQIEPLPQANEWSRRHGLDGKFVVMHSGNIGYAQNLDLLIRATTFLRDLEDLRVVIVGSGARQLVLMELRERLDANAEFLPYQPRETLSYSLSAATIHYVGLAHRLAGYVVPSRLYGVMAAGRPVLVAADAESETAQIVLEAECGIVVPSSRPDVLAKELRAVHDGVYDLEAMGHRAREYVVREGDRSLAVRRYRSLIEELLAERRS